MNREKIDRALNDIDDRYILEMENEESVGMGIFIDIYPYSGLGSALGRYG